MQGVHATILAISTNETDDFNRTVVGHAMKYALLISLVAPLAAAPMVNGMLDLMFLGYCASPSPLTH